MLRKISICILLLTSLTIYSQETKKEPINPLQTKFDGQSLVEVNYSYLTGSDYKLKMERPEKGLYEKGEIGNVQRINVGATVPFFYKKGLVLSALARYNYALTAYDRVRPQDIEILKLNHARNEETHSISGGLSGAYFVNIFKKRLLLTASVVADGSEKRFEYLTGLFTATMTVIDNETTRMSVGLFGSTSRAMQFPVFPIFTFRHRFEGTPYLLDIILPKQAYLTQLIGDNGRLSAGFSMDSQRGYIYPGQEGFKHTYTYDRIDMKLDARYEHMIVNKLVASANLGFVKCYRGVYREKNSTRDIARFSQDGGLFFSLGLRYQLR